MTDILLTRHGRTAWNAEAGEERFRGMVEVPLDEVGEAQARALGVRLNGLHIDAAYASPLGRTIRTAELALGSRDLTIQFSDGLKPLAYGDWAGLTLSEAAARDPESFDLYLHHIERLRFPGGESLGDVRERSMALVEEVVRAYPGGTVLLVTHQVVCRVLLCAMLGVDDSFHWHLAQGPACLNRSTWNGEHFVLQTVNDTCHLA